MSRSERKTFTLNPKINELVHFVLRLFSLLHPDIFWAKDWLRQEERNNACQRLNELKGHRVTGCNSDWLISLLHCIWITVIRTTKPSPEQRFHYSTSDKEFVFVAETRWTERICIAAPSIMHTHTKLTLLHRSLMRSTLYSSSVCMKKLSC